MPMTRRRGKEPVAYRNGIDRVDSKLGYLPHNVVSCCRLCNQAKSNLDPQEFIALCRRIAERHPPAALVEVA